MSSVSEAKRTLRLAREWISGRANKSGNEIRTRALAFILRPRLQNLLIPIGTSFVGVLSGRCRARDVPLGNSFKRCVCALAGGFQNRSSKDCFTDQDSHHPGFHSMNGKHLLRLNRGQRRGGLGELSLTDAVIVPSSSRSPCFCSNRLKFFRSF